MVTKHLIALKFQDCPHVQAAELQAAVLTSDTWPLRSQDTCSLSEDVSMLWENYKRSAFLMYLCEKILIFSPQ